MLQSVPKHWFIPRLFSCCRPCSLSRVLCTIRPGGPLFKTYWNSFLHDTVCRCSVSVFSPLQDAESAGFSQPVFNVVSGHLHSVLYHCPLTQFVRWYTLNRSGLSVMFSSPPARRYRYGWERTRHIILSGVVSLKPTDYLRKSLAAFPCRAVNAYTRYNPRWERMRDVICYAVIYWYRLPRQCKPRLQCFSYIQ